MAVYGYVRVSTDRQADDGESLGTQQRVIEGYAMMNGLTLRRHFVERAFPGRSRLASARGRRMPFGGAEGRQRGDHPQARSHVSLALNHSMLLGQLKDETSIFTYRSGR